VGFLFCTVCTLHHIEGPKWHTNPVPQSRNLDIGHRLRSPWKISGVRRDVDDITLSRKITRSTGAIWDNQSVPFSMVNKSKKKALVGEDVGECGLQNDRELVTTTEGALYVLDFLSLEDGNDNLLRKVGEE